MFRKFAPTDDQKRQIFEWLGLRDNYDKACPPNMREVAAGDYWFQISSYQPLAEGYHSFAKRSHGQWSTYYVVIYGDGHHCGRGGFVVEIFNDRERTVKYHSWTSCVHDFDHRSGGNCYHIHTCTKCGLRYDVDSSD